MNPPAIYNRTQVHSPYLRSLDLLRGFAALSVCLYHTGFLFTRHYPILPGGYLCVDVFFLLSGFVIARTYDPRIAAGLGIAGFCVQRLARLYPLFVMTTILGFAAVVARLHHDGDAAFTAAAAWTFLANLLLIPNILHPYGLTQMFPFNGAAWSIFFEFYVNVLFVVFWRRLDGRRLIGLALVSGLLLVVAGADMHTLDIGDKTADILAAAPRVVFSFTMGVLICRHGTAHPPLRGTWPSLAGLGIVAIAISMRGVVPGREAWLLDVATVMFVFPAILVAFTRMDFPRPHAQVAAFFGNISYSVYLLQTPLMIFYCGLPELVLQEKVAALVPWAGLVFVPLVIAVSYLVWRYFEIPAKRGIRDWQASVAARMAAIH